MVDAKEWVLALGKQKSVKDLVNEFQTNCNRLSKCFTKQSLPVEAAVTTIKAFVRDTATTTIKETCEGALFGLISGLLYKCSLRICSLSPPSSKQLAGFGEYRPLVQSFLAGRNLEHVRNFAVLTGVSASITCVLKEIRGKEDEDVETCIVAGFGFGVALSLVTGMRGPSVISVGVICALVNGGMYKLQETSEPQPAEDVVHTKTRGINQCSHCSERSQHPN